jgi:biopolymer transport protein ExbB
VKSSSLLDFVIEISILSGGLIPLMSVVFVIALALCIERWWFFRRNIKVGDAMEHDLRLVAAGNYGQLEQLSRHYEGSIQNVVINTALANRNQDRETVERQIDEAISWQLPKMDRNLWWVDTTVTLGPLMGLFGTIIGMIESFSVLGQAGAGNPDAVTGGVAHALVATALGLFIAMVCLVFLNFFNKKNRLAIHQLDLLRQMVVNRMFGAGAVDYGTRGEPAGAQAAAAGTRLADAK